MDSHDSQTRQEELKRYREEGEIAEQAMRKQLRRELLRDFLIVLGVGAGLYLLTLLLKSPE